ncbi:TIGR03086 family metal-binding protein [Sciscionella marina]|uniref:TIGR03086 family metal-binding protein n=1 Tax=Sciscionella marina TaxID=508770 RepID=UPI0003650113|nr:TIGR03086 family metal-binding protein [Sciscionella marina]
MAAPDQDSILQLLDPAFTPTGELLRELPAERYTDPSPCQGWTVRNVADHLINALDLFARLAEGETGIDFTAPEPEHADPAGAFTEASGRCAAALRRPGTLDAELPFPGGAAPGWVHAHIAISESLIHGWDIASASGRVYRPDERVVSTTARFQAQGDEEERRASGMFRPAVAAPEGAGEFERLLAFLGRRA